jgi:singapore isolate B (sub-type 7) whole genome shotgun sequence assembly, scaffold_1
LNEHEREIAEADHLTEQKEHPTLSKPRISKAMRAMLKKSGQKTINVKELMKHTVEVPTEEVVISNMNES